MCEVGVGAFGRPRYRCEGTEWALAAVKWLRLCSGGGLMWRHGGGGAVD